MIEFKHYDYTSQEEIDNDVIEAKEIYGNDITIGEFVEFKERKLNQFLIQSKTNYFER